MLTRRGADLLAERWGMQPESICAPPHRIRAIQNLDHTLAIGRLYAALRAELEYRGRQLAQWQGDLLLSRDAYDRNPVVGLREPLPILPDATFLLEAMRYKEYAIGEGMLAEAEALKVDPSAVKQLGPGECVVIAGGRAQHIIVSQIFQPSQAPAPAIAADVIKEIQRPNRRTHRRSETIAPMTADLPRAASPSTQAANPASEASIRKYE